MAATTETITYKVILNDQIKVESQTTTSYDISGLEPGDYVIKVEGTCQHGTVKSATLSFSIHADYTITINPYTQGDQTITWSVA